MHLWSLLLMAFKPLNSDNPKDYPYKFPAKEHCSKCGLCETSYISQVRSACSFLEDRGMSKIHLLEEQVHGRQRKMFDDKIESNAVTADNVPFSWVIKPKAVNKADEFRFGVMSRRMKYARGTHSHGGQWSGVVTGIALAMMETDQVDAVVCIASSGDSWTEPKPIIARNSEEILHGRGVKPALAPTLRVLDEVKNDPKIKRLLVCGVGCAVQALRSIQNDLGLDELYVVGTNCADNSPSPEAAKMFIEEAITEKIETQSDNDQKDNYKSSVLGYEFMQDFRVHVKIGSTGRSQGSPDGISFTKKPYFCLPGKIAETAIAKSCLECFDYTNALADVVIGYMGAPLIDGESMTDALQTITIRNDRGEKMVQTAVDRNKIQLFADATGSGSHEQVALATVNSDGIVTKAAGGQPPENGMPVPIGEILASVMTTLSPKGVNFARYSIDYHLLRNYLYLLSRLDDEISVERMLPFYALGIVKRYEDDKSFFDLKQKILKQKSR